jgi:hypothetical protein
MAATELPDATQCALLASPLLRDLCLSDASAALLAALGTAAPSLGLQPEQALLALSPLLPPAPVQPAPPLGDDPIQAAFAIFKRPAPLRNHALLPLVAAWRVADFLALPVASAVEEELVRRFAVAPRAAAAPEWRQAHDADGGHALFERVAARYAAYRAAWVRPRVLRCGVGPFLRKLLHSFHTSMPEGWTKHTPPPAFALSWAPEDDAAICDTWWGIWKFRDEAAHFGNASENAVATFSAVTVAVGHAAFLRGVDVALWGRYGVPRTAVAAAAVGAAVGRRMDVLTALRAALVTYHADDGGAVPRGCTVAQLVAAVESRWPAGVEHLLAELAPGLPAAQHERLAAAARAVAARAPTDRTPPPREWVPDIDTFDYDAGAIPFGSAIVDPFETGRSHGLA